MFVPATNFYSILTDMSSIKNLPLGVITCLSTNMNKLTSATGIYNSNSLLRSLLMKRMEVQLTLIKPSPGLSCGRITRNQPSGRVSGRLSVTGVKMAYRKLLFQLFRSSERKSAHSWLGKLLICFPNIEKYCKSVEARCYYSLRVLVRMRRSHESLSRKFMIFATSSLASLFLRSL